MFHGMPSSSGSEKRTPTSVPSPGSNVAEISHKVFGNNPMHPSLESFPDNLLFEETRKDNQSQNDYLLDGQQKEGEKLKSFESEDNRKVEQSSTGSISSHLQDMNDEEERRKREIRIQRNRESAMRYVHIFHLFRVCYILNYQVAHSKK